MRAAQYLSDTSLLAEQTERVVRTLGKDGEEADGGWIDSEHTVYPENYSSNRLPPSSLYCEMKMGTATSRIVSHHDQPYKCDRLYMLYRHGFASQKLLLCCDNLSVCTITISADQNSQTTSNYSDSSHRNGR